MPLFKKIIVLYKKSKSVHAGFSFLNGCEKYRRLLFAIRMIIRDLDRDVLSRVC